MTEVIDRPTTRPFRPAEESSPGIVDGDASVHLEELVAGELPAQVSAVETAVPGVAIELVGPHLRVSGTVSIGYHRRLSDFVNSHEGLFSLRNAMILRRNGEPTKVTMPDLWVGPDEITLLGQATVEEHGLTPADFYIPKTTRQLIVVTPGHTLTGSVYLTAGAELSVFVESPSPQFVPMTDVRTRSLADRRVVSRYAFALLNRRHMVAVTELQPGMVSSRSGV